MGGICFRGTAFYDMFPLGYSKELYTKLKIVSRPTIKKGQKLLCSGGKKRKQDKKGGKEEGKEGGKEGGKRGRIKECAV